MSRPAPRSPVIACGPPWRGTWTLCALALLLACGAPCAWSRAAAAAPRGVHVRLATLDAKTDYELGEAIPLRVVFSSRRPGYRVDATRYGLHGDGVHDTVTVSPADRAFHWHGQDESDEVEWQPLTAQGLAIDILLNNVVILKAAGTYRISVTTTRLARASRHGGRQGAPPVRFTITTNTVTIHVSPMSEEEETGRVAALTARLSTAQGDARRYGTAMQIACLVGDVAAREKVRLYLDPFQGLAVKQAMEKGLALSSNRPLELALLDQAWKAKDTVPSETLLTQMITLRQLDAGLAVRGSSSQPALLLPEESASLRELRSIYLEEIEKTLPQRDAENRAQTQAILASLAQSAP